MQLSFRLRKHCHLTDPLILTCKRLAYVRGFNQKVRQSHRYYSSKMVTIVPKTVCVIGMCYAFEYNPSRDERRDANNSTGAGPSGLVAAKTLTHNFPTGSFKVCLVEKADRIGGLWPSEQGAHDEEQRDIKERNCERAEMDNPPLMAPDMSTNQSRHTVSFSDHAWDAATRQFPKMWQVGRYLQGYAQRYAGYEVRLGCEVTDVYPTTPDALKTTAWVVQMKNRGGNGESEKRTFDHVIIASGYFGPAKISDAWRTEKNDSTSLSTSKDNTKIPVRHSLEVRDVYQVLQDEATGKMAPGTNIVVIGGQMSGVEAAAAMAHQLSSAKYSPRESRLARLLPDAQRYQVHHVIQRPFWMMPLFVPRDSKVIVGTELVSTSHCIRLHVNDSRSPTLLRFSVPSIWLPIILVCAHLDL